MSTIALTAIIALSAQSCRSSKLLTTTTLKNDSIVIIENVRDTIIILPPDSAWLKAWLQCDSTGNILMQRLETYNSKTIRTIARITPTTVGAIVTLDCKTDSLEMLISVKDRTIRHLQQSQTIRYIEVERQLSWWQQTQIHLGRALLALLAAAVVYATIKLKH